MGTAVNALPSRQTTWKDLCPSLDVLGEKFAMEIISYSVIDEPPPLLLRFARLILEHNVVIPPGTMGGATIRQFRCLNAMAWTKRPLQHQPPLDSKRPGA